MKYKRLITVTVVALTATSYSAVISSSDFDSDTVGFGPSSLPASMGFTDGGGDHPGQSQLGVSAGNPRSGANSYVVDAGAVSNGHGWGGTWSGSSSLGGGTGSNVVSQADAEANATPSNPLSYVKYDEGCTFTVSAWFATDATDPATGTFINHVRLEFGTATTADVIPRQFSVNYTPSTLTTGYQFATVSYTLTAADVAMGIDRVVGVIGSDAITPGSADGLVYVDDFSFEVDDGSFVTVIPEPSSAVLGIFGIFGLALRRRR